VNEQFLLVKQNSKNEFGRCFKMQSVSVIIPTFNGRHLLEKHLSAVCEMIRTGDELLIVDDHSTDDTVAYLKQKYALEEKKPRFFQATTSYRSKTFIVTLVLTHKNLRFAGAANTGATLAQHAFIFLLNNDVSPQKDVLNYLLPYFEDKTMFAVGCKEYESSDTGQVSGRNELWFERGMFMHSRAKSMKSGPTAWVSGGSGMFDREKWILLGGFDVRFYPAYWEDIDLSLRAKKRGWKVMFEENAIVFHKHESTHQTVFGQQQINAISLTNSIKFTLKHATTTQLAQFVLWRPYWFLKTIKK
jgi:GT2 family glycosyltransferase